MKLSEVELYNVTGMQHEEIIRYISVYINDLQSKLQPKFAFIDCIDVKYDDEDVIVIVQTPFSDIAHIFDLEALLNEVHTYHDMKALTLQINDEIKELLVSCERKLTWKTW